MKKILFLISLFTSLSLLYLVLPAKADSTTIVRPDDMATSFADIVEDPTKWFFYNDESDTIDNTLGTFVDGPDTPPMGVGSAEISVIGTQRRNLATYQFSGTPLDEITTLAFSTYNPSVGNGGSADRSGYLNFNVDFDLSDTWQRRLVFVPRQNGTVMQDTWQEWDALMGGDANWVYSGTTWPVTGEAGTTMKTWSEILEDYPDARIRVTDSWLGVRAGEPYADGYTENIDMFKFGVNGDTTTFDFEPADGDNDLDGVLNENDMCPDTVTDEDGWDVKYGVNRYELRFDEESDKYMWVQNTPKNGVLEVQDLSYTYGCSGHQILQMYMDAFGDMKEGHWKYGLSSGLVDEFHMDMMDGELNNGEEI